MILIFRVIIVLFTLLLTACIGQEDPPSDAPANVTVSEGEALVVVDWDVVAGRTYWLYYKEGSSVSIDDYSALQYNKTPPFLASGLENGTQYAFSVTSSADGSRVGPFSTAITATPRLLGPSTPWFEGTSLTVNDLRSIAFGNNIYVTTGDAATVFVGAYNYTSDGGVEAWEQPASLPLDASVNLNSVIFDGIRFLSMADDGSIMTSTDAMTWVLATAITGAAVMNALAVSSGVYVAVGDSGAIYTNNTDGASAEWVAQSSGTANDLYGIAFVNDRFIAVGELGTLLTSSDGVTWAAQTSNSSEALRQVAFGAGNYVAVGDAGAIVSSADAIDWSAQSIPGTESFRAICYGPDEQFIAVGTTGTLAYSSTGTEASWAISNAGSIDLNSITPHLVFIATGAAGVNVSGK